LLARRVERPHDREGPKAQNRQFSQFGLLSGTVWNSN